MIKYRMILSIATFALLIIAAVLYVAPFDSWLAVVAKIGVVLISVFALAAMSMFVFTLFPAGDDISALWKTGYFRYMRAFYGYAWGESGYRYRQIDICKAVRLSALVVLLWLLALGAMGTLWYANINFVMSGMKSVGALPIISESGVHGTFFLYDIFGLMASFLVGLFVFLLPSLGHLDMRIDYSNSFLRVILGAWLFTIVGSAFLLATVIPVMYYGWFVYFKTIVVIFITVASLAVFLVSIYAIVMIFRKVFRLTVPGRLIAEGQKGLKDKLCLMIAEKEEEQV